MQIPSALAEQLLQEQHTYFEGKKMPLKKEIQKSYKKAFLKSYKNKITLLDCLYTLHKKISIFHFCKNPMKPKRTTEIFIKLCPLKIKVNQLCTSSLSYLHLKKKKIRERTVTFTISLPSPFFNLLVQSYAISLQNIKCIC